MLIPNAPALSEMSEGSSTIPEATYNLRIVKAEYVAVPKSVDAKGPYIKTQSVVTGPGDTKALGRMVFMNYSLTGDGSFRLRELLAVTGHAPDYRIQDSDEMIGWEYGAAVIVEKGTGGYQDKNAVRKHLPLL